jgi:predicted ATPase
VLRNISGRSSVDNRYETIIDFMRQSFPNTFRDLVLDATAPTVVYGSFVMENIQDPIQASGVSNGHLQMLIHLTALFSDGQDKRGFIMFDKPETSLHPHALSIFSKAVQVAAREWNKQIIVSTHSPVLISEFPLEKSFVLKLDDQGSTKVDRVSELQGVSDLLDQYKTGYLYMAEVIGSQET